MPGWQARLAGLHVGAFWDPGDPVLISLPGPAWRGAGYTLAFLVVDVRGGEDRAQSETASFRLVAGYGPLAKTLRRTRPVSISVGPSVGSSGRANVRLTWQNQGKRHPTPRSRRTARTMITATQCRCASTPPLVCQQAVERRLSEPKRNPRLRAGTSAAERYYDRRYSARL